MIVDTSAILAILFAEDDAPAFANALSSKGVHKISVANFLEAAIVIDSQLGAKAGRQLDALIARAELVITTVNFEQVHVARQAYLDFGKGNHVAGLNFGDCFAYALT
ncbi:MAG: type II toxin-antitoxin system VapC family toxin, partial [Deltaproteobacteria bacterium]|nr:type II toxin-antitoxin system VapC family toxin [Deltaproteobacteria bacterium]